MTHSSPESSDGRNPLVPWWTGGPVRTQYARLLTVVRTGPDRSLLQLLTSNHQSHPRSLHLFPTGSGEVRPHGDWDGYCSVPTPRLLSSRSLPDHRRDSTPFREVRWFLLPVVTGSTHPSSPWPCGTSGHLPPPVLMSPSVSDISPKGPSNPRSVSTGVQTLVPHRPRHQTRTYPSSPTPLVSRVTEPVVVTGGYPPRHVPGPPRVPCRIPVSVDRSNVPVFFYFVSPRRPP